MVSWYSLVPIRRHVPINSHASRHWKSHNPIKRHTYKGICNGCYFDFIKGAPRSASKLSNDPINSHASYFGKSTGSNKRSLLINRTVSSNCNQRVCVIRQFRYGNTHCVLPISPICTLRTCKYFMYLQVSTLCTSYEAWHALASLCHEDVIICQFNCRWGWINMRLSFVAYHIFK